MEVTRASLRHGTIGGTLLVLLNNVTSHPFFETAMMSAIGAAVSFIVSWSLKELIQHLKARFRRRKRQ